MKIEIETLNEIKDYYSSKVSKIYQTSKNQDKLSEYNNKIEFYNKYDINKNIIYQALQLKDSNLINKIAEKIVFPNSNPKLESKILFLKLLYHVLTNYQNKKPKLTISLLVRLYPFYPSVKIKYHIYFIGKLMHDVNINNDIYIYFINNTCNYLGSEILLESKDEQYCLSNYDKLKCFNKSGALTKIFEKKYMNLFEKTIGDKNIEEGFKLDSIISFSDDIVKMKYYINKANFVKEFNVAKLIKINYDLIELFPTIDHNKLISKLEDNDINIVLKIIESKQIVNLTIENYICCNLFKKHDFSSWIQNKEEIIKLVSILISKNGKIDRFVSNCKFYKKNIVKEICDELKIDL